MQGEGGADFLNWSARHYTDAQFLETYQDRANHMVALHGDRLLPATVKRLKSIFPE